MHEHNPARLWIAIFAIAMPVCTLWYMMSIGHYQKTRALIQHEFTDSRTVDHDVRAVTQATPLVITEEQGYTPSSVIDLMVIGPCVLLLLSSAFHICYQLRKISASMQDLAASQKQQADAIASLLTRIRPKS